MFVIAEKTPMVDAHVKKTNRRQNLSAATKVVVSVLTFALPMLTKRAPITRTVNTVTVKVSAWNAKKVITKQYTRENVWLCLTAGTLQLMAVK